MPENVLWALYCAGSCEFHAKFKVGKPIRKWGDKCGVVISENPDDEELSAPSCKLKRIFTHGSFENVGYFKGIEPILRKEFTPSHPISDYNQSLYNIIKNSNSVFLGVRRGDFMQGENRKIFYVCDRDYYQRAINYIKEHVTNPVFIVFSNDIPWTKHNLDIPGEVHYESGHDAVYETFRLMYSCHHFIISNSTLHWWAQYRSENKNKIVVAPERWYNAPGWEEHLMLPYFVRLKTGVRNPYKEV